MIRQTLTAAVLFVLNAAALAGPAADHARQHFNSIAAGDVGQMMKGYHQDATLQWVGGPLDGVYAGEARLREVWTKFSTAQGRLDVAVNNLLESANPKGTTVTANVEFKGKTSIKVRYVLTYRDGQIVNEVWQIDPRLGESNLAGY